MPFALHKKHGEQYAIPMTNRCGEVIAHSGMNKALEPAIWLISKCNKYAIVHALSTRHAV